MRRIGTALVLTCLSVVAHAQDPRVDNFFGPTLPIRQKAQLDFTSRYLSDQGAIQALIDATDQHLQSAHGTFSPGVYDAISVLARVPPDSVTDSSLRTRIVQVAHASRVNSQDTEVRAALIESRFSAAARPLPPPLPPLPANPGPVVALPPQQNGIGYTITVSEMTVVKGVSNSSETDYVSLVVIGPDGQIGPFSWGPKKLKTGDTPALNLSSDMVRVANNQVPVRVSWTAVNHEDTSKIKTVSLALGNAAADLARGLGNPLMAIPGEIAKAGLSLIKACDTQLFDGAIVLYPDQLKDGEDSGNWQYAAPRNRWHRLFEYSSVASPCNTGQYKLEVDVERHGAGGN